MARTETAIPFAPSYLAPSLDVRKTTPSCPAVRGGTSMIPYSLDNSSYDNLIVGIWNRQLSVFRTGDEYPNKGIGQYPNKGVCRYPCKGIGYRYYIPTIAGTIYLQLQVLNTDDGRCRTPMTTDTGHRRWQILNTLDDRNAGECRKRREGNQDAVFLICPLVFYAVCGVGSACMERAFHAWAAKPNSLSRKKG